MNNKLNLPPFYVGQKVVCVKDTWVAVDYGVYFKEPKKGLVYTCNHVNFDSCFNLWFIGFVETDQDDEFSALHFAPIQEQKPPLLTFTQIKENEKEEILILN